MSLRFERKGSLRLPSGFSSGSGSKWGGFGTNNKNKKIESSEDYIKSWSFRQCQFACDYLKLMDPPRNRINTEGNDEEVGLLKGGSCRSRVRPKLVEVEPSVTTTTTPVVKSEGMSTIAGVGDWSTSSRGSMVSTVSSLTSGFGSIGNYYGELLDLGFELELDSDTDLENRRVDPFRFSQATLEDAQDDELNAILGELSALQLSLDREIKPTVSSNQSQGQNSNQSHLTAHLHSQNNTKTMSTISESGGRTESPDNDSGFSDNASLLSSGSSLSASGSSSGSSTTSHRINPHIQPSSVLHSNEDEKAEKIRVALAKMRAASVTRLYVKAFSPDGSSKALMVEESMSAGRVLALLADKNHVPLSQKWALVEHVPHLHMERIYEDHENMVENLLMWTRDSKNKIYFIEREEKYDMFLNPQRYFGIGSAPLNQQSMDEHGKQNLVQEFFNHGHGVPEVESNLYLKAEGKKAWKKFPFVLRASGIYYYPKGRSHTNSSKDLVCLATIDHNTEAYEGVGWRKKFKAPTEFGFVLKPARLQVKSHRHMKYLVAEDYETLRHWMVGLRIAKHGKALWENYRSLQEDIAHEDLDRFGRSVSLASMPIQISTTNYHEQSSKEGKDRKYSIEERKYTNDDRKYSIDSDPTTVPVSISLATPLNNHVTNEKSSSSSSDRMVLVTQGQCHPPTTLQTIVLREEGFESDSPVGGTIKRKPSTVLSPKIPLTLNTRSLVSEYITPGEGNTVTLAHTLQRKRSISGNNSGTINNSSSSSTPTCGISIISPVNPILGKTSMSLLVSSKPPTGLPISVTEETLDSLEIANLPPPPPELLEFNGCDEVNVVVTTGLGNESPPNESPCLSPGPRMSILKSSNDYSPRSGGGGIGTLPSSPYRVHSTTDGSGNSQSLPKKGVTFANELSQRLMSRKNVNVNVNPVNSENPLINRIAGNFQISSPVSVSVSVPVPIPPNRLDEPPQDFLTDLQRVMQKKWQVAQKCHVDRNTSPQEILGFRFEPNGSQSNYPESPLSEECQSENGDPVNPSSLNNVRAWVSQHYGGDCEEVNNTRKPLPPLPNTKPQPPRVGFSQIVTRECQGQGGPSPNFPPPPVPLVYQSPSSVVIYENFQGRKHSLPNNLNNYTTTNNSQNQQQQYQVLLRSKKPPPPIPKRADSTHLSAHFVYN